MLLKVEKMCRTDNGLAILDGIASRSHERAEPLLIELIKVLDGGLN